MRISPQDNKDDFGVIFDLGRVLVDIDMERGLFGRLTGCAGQSPQAIMEHLKRDGLFTALCGGKICSRDFHRELCARTGMKQDFADFAREWCDIFRPMPGMDELVDAVLASGVRVGILSDTDALHWEYLRGAFAMVAKIPYPTLSYEVGATKPMPVMYEQAAGSLGLTCSACFFTDDLEENVRGARDAGMDAEVFTDPGSLREHLAIRGVL